MNISLIFAIAYFSGYSTMLYQDALRIWDTPESPTLQTTIGAEVEYGFLGGRVTVDTLVVPQTPVRYTPYHATYTTDIYAKYKNFQAGWEHQCEHPVLSRALDRPVKTYGGYDKFYIKGKVTLQGGR